MFASGSSSSNEEDKSSPTDNKTPVSNLGLLMCAGFLFISMQVWKGSMGSYGWSKPVLHDIVRGGTVTALLLVIKFGTGDNLFVKHNTYHCVTQPCWFTCMNTAWIKFWSHISLPDIKFLWHFSMLLLCLPSKIVHFTSSAWLGEFCVSFLAEFLK